MTSKSELKAYQADCDVVFFICICFHYRCSQSDNFKLNLFGDDELGLGSGRSGSSGGGAVLMFGARGKNDSYRKQAGLASMMKGLDMSPNPGGAEDDLLELMDGA